MNFNRHRKVSWPRHGLAETEVVHRGRRYLIELQTACTGALGWKAYRHSGEDDSEAVWVPVAANNKFPREIGMLANAFAQAQQAELQAGWCRECGKNTYKDILQFGAFRVVYSCSHTPKDPAP